MRQAQIHPMVCYQWQRQCFKNGAAAFESKQSKAFHFTLNQDRHIFLPSQLCSRRVVSSCCRCIWIRSVGRKWLREFQRDNLAMLSSPDLPKHLDLVTDNFAKTLEYLAKNECPAAAGAASLALPTAGCKAFTWNNQ